MANITIRNAKILYRNFAGKGGDYNPEGNRNFCVILTKEQYDELKSINMNVKFKEPKDPADDILYYLPVKVQYGDYPPDIWMVTKKKKTLLDESNIMLLDVAEIDYVDLEVTQYRWKMNKNTGIKAYAKKMFVNIVEDPLEEKYADVPESALACMGDDCD
jgi:hypothetical protein